MTRRIAGAFLILLMAVGSILLWIGIPVGWLYLVSQLVDSSQPSMGPYVLVLVGIPATMIAVGKVLAILDRAYGRVTRTAPQGRVQTPWHRSLRGERSPARAHSVLDVVMVASVALALVCFAVWSSVSAGWSLPGWRARTEGGDQAGGAAAAGRGGATASSHASTSARSSSKPVRGRPA